MQITSSTRVLCCCAHGHVRSVALRYILYSRLGNGRAIACGLLRNDADTLGMLYRWAEVIAVAGEEALVTLVPEKYKDKLLHVNIGEDVWGNAFHPDLQSKLTYSLQGHI